MNNSDHVDKQFTPDTVDQQIDSLLLPNAPQQQHADYSELRISPRS